METVPPETRRVAPVTVPVSEPPFQLDVPETFVRLTPLVPPLELIAEKFVLSATPLATIAAPAAVVLFIAPVALVTLTVPPPVAFRAVPLLRWIVKELKVRLAPATPLQLTAVLPTPVLVALVAP